jgi:myo-inositol-1(or 4)-monophosphatase
VLEAGGTVTGFDGSPFQLESREVLATNGPLQQEMITLFEEMFAGRGLSPIPTPQEFAARRMARSATKL